MYRDTSEPASARFLLRCSGDISLSEPMLLHFGAPHKGRWDPPSASLPPCLRQGLSQTLELINSVRLHAHRALEIRLNLPHHPPALGLQFNSTMPR